MKLHGVVLVSALVGGTGLLAQAPTYTNSVGMEFVLIKPGSMIVGKFEPPYPKPVDPAAASQAARGGTGGRGGAGTTLAPQMLADGDKNGDQKLSKDELGALTDAWFDQLDPGKTGKVNAQDFAQRFAALTAAAPGRGNGAAVAGGAPGAGAGAGTPGAFPGGGGGRGGGRGGVGPTLFSVADRNKDGSVTRDELKATFETWFTSWDTAKSGALTLDQLTAGLNAALPPPAGGGRGTPLTAGEYARTEQMAKADYSPGFPVTIERAYYIGKYEVTQAQWKKVMGTNPSIFQGDKVTGDADFQGAKIPNDADRHPVENITWDDAQAFVKKLNATEKTNVYRLPTEFEWEYAARAGKDADTPWTEIRQQAWAGYNQYTSTFMVGLKQPNAWGLYDMLGNVWEWVQDYYNEKIFADPTPPKTGKVHVLKGGGFVADVKNAIPATHAGGPGSKFDVGVRLVRDVR